MPIKEASISPLDRGFLFADGVYEHIQIYENKLFYPEKHLARLKRNLNAINIPALHSNAEWLTIFNTLIEKNHIDSGSNHIYLQVTRGADDHRAHVIPEKLTPTIFALTDISYLTKSIEGLAKGSRAVTIEDARRRDCCVKAISLLPNILARTYAVEHNATETIMLRDNLVTECASCNVFIVKNGIIMTPPLSSNILPGITRELTLELAAKNSMPYKEQPITKDELQNANEVWITSSSREIEPITTLDNKPVADGKAGPIWYKMITLYKDLY
ncbi:MAG: aminotransferase class IV [Gammaproteobacteria bacterium]|nr:aminotransferase class IV [Gammaproteobacteria bacterium]